MSYAIINAKGLAGIGHPQTPRGLLPGGCVVRPNGLIAPVLGGIPGDVSPKTVDGTSTGEREMMIAALSIQVHEWQQQVQKALDGDLSLTGTLARGLLFVPSAYQNRQHMIKAKNDLAAFMIDIAARLRNYQQPTAPVMEYAVAVLQAIASQIGATLTSQATSTLRGLAQNVKKETISNANALLSAARDAGKGATEGVFPWWAAPAAGIFIVAYLVNTLKMR